MVVGAIGAVGSTAGALGSVLGGVFSLLKMFPALYRGAKMAKKLYDKYGKLKGMLGDARERFEDMMSKIPPNIKIKMRKADVDWDGVPPKPIWKFTKAPCCYDAQHSEKDVWVTRAVKANFRAARAAREAEDDLAEAAHHEEVALAAARAAEQAASSGGRVVFPVNADLRDGRSIWQAHAWTPRVYNWGDRRDVSSNRLLRSVCLLTDAWQNAVRSPRVQPFLHYCNYLAKVVAEDPSHARDPAMLDLRRFCQGFQEDLQSIVEAFATDPPKSLFK
eukprot:s3930_g1.t1